MLKLAPVRPRALSSCSVVAFCFWPIFVNSALRFLLRCVATLSSLSLRKIVWTYDTSWICHEGFFFSVVDIREIALLVFLPCGQRPRRQICHSVLRLPLHFFFFASLSNFAIVAVAGVQLAAFAVKSSLSRSTFFSQLSDDLSVRTETRH